MCRLLDYVRYECKSGANRDNADLSAVSVAERLELPGRQTRAALIVDGGVAHLAGSVVENPHGLLLNTFKFSPRARRIVHLVWSV